MKTKYTPFYICRDRYEIFTLLAAHCIVDGYEPDKRGVFYFRFEDKEKCERILAQMFSKQLIVYAHDFVDAIRTAQAIFYR